jgi:hypothetical protein
MGLGEVLGPRKQEGKGTGAVLIIEGLKRNGA